MRERAATVAATTATAPAQALASGPRSPLREMHAPNGRWDRNGRVPSTAVGGGGGGGGGSGGGGAGGGAGGGGGGEDCGGELYESAKRLEERGELAAAAKNLRQARMGLLA